MKQGRQSLLPDPRLVVGSDLVVWQLAPGHVCVAVHFLLCMQCSAKGMDILTVDKELQNNALSVVLSYECSVQLLKFAAAQYNCAACIATRCAIIMID